MAFDSENNIYIVQNVVVLTSPRGAPLNTIELIGTDVLRLNDRGQEDFRFGGDGHVFFSYIEGTSAYVIEAIVDDQDRLFLVGPKVERPFFGILSAIAGGDRPTVGVADTNSAFRVEGSQLIEDNSIL